MLIVEEVLQRINSVITSYFRKYNHVRTVVFEDSRILNAYLGTTVCLQEIIADLRKQNVQHHIFHHHGIASTAFQATISRKKN